MCIIGLAAPSTGATLMSMARQWLGCSSMARADAVVAQGQAQVAEIVLRSTLICTKPNWFHWEPSQNKAQLPGMRGRGWAGKVHSHRLEGHTGVMSQAKSLIHQRLLLSPAWITGSHLIRCPGTERSPGFAAAPQPWALLVPEGQRGWESSSLGVATAGQDQEPCTGHPILYSVWTGSLGCFKDEDWGFCDFSSVLGFKRALLLLLQELCCKGRKQIKHFSTSMDFSWTKPQALSSP